MTARCALDEHGNPKGGIRNVWVDVPKATYGVLGKGKTPATDRLCQLGGTEVPLSEVAFRRSYGTRATYASSANARLAELIRDGWYLPEYADFVREDIQAVVGATR